MKNRTLAYKEKIDSWNTGQKYHSPYTFGSIQKDKEFNKDLPSEPSSRPDTELASIPES